MNEKLNQIINWCLNIISWFIAGFVALFFRYEALILPSVFVNYIFFTLLIIPIQFANIKINSAIFGRPKKLTIEEFFFNLRVFVFSGVLGSLFLLFIPFFLLPRSFPLLTSILALGIFLSSKKTLKFIFIKFLTKKRSIPIVIYGAGAQGLLLLEKILSDRSLDWKPLFFVDDNKDLGFNKLNGVKILKGVDLVEVLKRFPIKILIVSFSNVSGLRLQKLQDVCEKFDVELKIIASEKILIGKEFSSLDIRSPSIAELIGKSEIKIDYKSASEFISGKRVLITGAGGSIGYELSKQISEFNPALLILLDRDESSLLRVNVDLTKSSLVTPNVILADIRDFDRIQKIVSSFKPDIIFHTAALKHVQMLENFPDEALKTNVLATHNLLLAADENNVKVFVNISTDKAADPISVLGISKLASERLTAGFAINSQNAGSRYMSVRFGNVFGSRGSVLETFTKQITLNGPITVTDPKVKRFFMTAQEAIHLVIRAAVFGTNGHTIVLRMDNQLYVRDIAEKLIKKSGKQIDIIYTGLRVGEKITEKLVGTNEIQLATIDKDLFSVAVKPWWLSQNSSSWDEFISKFPFNH